MTAPTFIISVLGKQVAAAATDRSARIAGLRVHALPVGAPWTGAAIHGLAASGGLLIDTGVEPAQRRRHLVLARHLGVPRLAFAAPGPPAAGDPAIASGLVAEARLAGFETVDMVTIADAADFLAWARRAMSDAAGQRMDAVPFRLVATSSSEAQAATKRVAGAVLSGAPAAGQEMLVLPEAVPGRIDAIEVPGTDSAYLEVQLDRPVPWSPGSFLVPAAERPEMADQVAAQIVWIGPRPLLPGRPYTIDLAGQSASAQISALKHRIDPQDFAPAPARKLEAGDIGSANVSFSAPLIFDAFAVDRATGRFAILDRQSGALAGFGLISFPLRRATNIHRQALAVNKAARAALKGQRPCCLWFTGLSGSGKSTVASQVEKTLNGLGRHTYVLDGDNIRHGLNRDLGFTDADRVENIRRVAEVAKLFVDAGLIVMVSFISPFRAERRLARDLFAPGEFLEIFVDTPLEICEQRDPKGLYKKARAGQLKNFTGIDSAYEPPDAAELHLDGGTQGAETLVAQVMADLARRGVV